MSDYETEEVDLRGAKQSADNEKPGSGWRDGLDDYEVMARLLPATLAVAPLVAVVAALGLKESVAVSAVAGVVTLAGLSFCLATAARSRGKIVEDRVVRERGWPTGALLRADVTAHSAASKDQRARWRAQVEHATGMELGDGTAASDGLVSAVVDELRLRARTADGTSRLKNE